MNHLENILFPYLKKKEKEFIKELKSKFVNGKWLTQI